MVRAQLASKNGAESRAMAYWSYESPVLNIDNDEYLTDLTSELVIVFDKKRIEKLLIALENRDEENGFDFEIIGSTRDVNISPEIDSTWFRFPTGAGSVLSLTTDTKFISDAWMWIILRVKRAVPGTDCTATISATALPRV